MPARPKQSAEDELPTVIAAMLFSTRRWRQPPKRIGHNQVSGSQLSVPELTAQTKPEK